MASNYQTMLKDAQERLTLVDKERDALLGLIDNLSDLILIASGKQPEYAVTTPDALPDVEAAPQSTLLELAVAILQRQGTPARGIELLKAIRNQTSRNYDYSSLSKALTRDAENPEGRVIKNADKTWALKEW